MVVFRGADRLLLQLRPLIICEVLDKVTGPWGYPARDIIAKLQRCGYDWYEVLQDGSLRRHRVQSEYPEVRNYLAVPREKRHSIEPIVTRSPRPLADLV